MYLSNSLMHSKHFTNKPAILDKISCPICCIPFQGLYRPMVSCENRHTICIKCIDKIIQKSLTTTEQKCLCPICRQRIHLPLQSSEELKQFMELITTLNEMYKNIDNWQQRSLRLQRELREAKQQINQAKRKASASENMVQLLKMQINELKSRLQRVSKRTNEDEKENMFMVQRGKDESKEKKLPLSAFVDDMASEQHLNLLKKDFSVKHVQYLVMYDMTKLLEVNLSTFLLLYEKLGYNLLGDEGLYVLLKEKFMPNLTSLKLCNNQITKLPSLKHISQLQELDLCNFPEPKHPNANRIKEACIESLFEEKWDKLKKFGIELENDKVWQADDFQNTFIERFPVIISVELSNCKQRIPKTKCQRIKTALNDKGKRQNNNRIVILSRGY